MCIFFGIFYSCSCLTKLIPDYYILLLGRLLSGVATSLLFSAFESWMVFEHNRAGYPPEWLAGTFSLATFGNGVVAIGAGLVATLVAQQWGYVAPFMVSLGLLVIATIMVASSWNENYGDARIDVKDTFLNAIATLKGDYRVPLLGGVQSLFEASMYTFVFMWTPALRATAGGEQSDDEEDGMLGLIFACFMVCIMIGSSVFVLMLRSAGQSLSLAWLVSAGSAGSTQPSMERIGRLLLAVAAAAFAVPCFTTSRMLVLSSFLLFEGCCGLYFPCMGTLRGSYIPEHTRAAVMNFFRLPMNFLVVVVLLNVQSLSNTTVFLVTFLWLAVATAGQHHLVGLKDAQQAQSTGGSDAVDIPTGMH